LLLLANAAEKVLHCSTNQTFHTSHCATQQPTLLLWTYNSSLVYIKQLYDTAKLFALQLML